MKMFERRDLNMIDIAITPKIQERAVKTLIVESFLWVYYYEEQDKKNPKHEEDIGWGLHEARLELFKELFSYVVGSITDEEIKETLNSSTSADTAFADVPDWRWKDFLDKAFYDIRTSVDFYTQKYK